MVVQFRTIVITIQRQVCSRLLLKITIAWNMYVLSERKAFNAIFQWFTRPVVRERKQNQRRDFTVQRLRKGVVRWSLMEGNERYEDGAGSWKGISNWNVSRGERKGVKKNRSIPIHPGGIQVFWERDKKPKVETSNDVFRATSMSWTSKRAKWPLPVVDGRQGCFAWSTADVTSRPWNGSLIDQREFASDEYPTWDAFPFFFIFFLSFFARLLFHFQPRNRFPASITLIDGTKWRHSTVELLLWETRICTFVCKDTDKLDFPFLPQRGSIRFAWWTCFVGITAEPHVYRNRKAWFVLFEGRTVTLEFFRQRIFYIS